MGQMKPGSAEGRAGQPARPQPRRSRVPTHRTLSHDFDLGLPFNRGHDLTTSRV